MSEHPSWKKAERRVARFFGAERAPLSGGNSGHTRSDSLHPTLFLETKYASGPTGTNGWLWRWLRGAEWHRGLIRADGLLYAQHCEQLNGVPEHPYALFLPAEECPVAGRRLYNATSDLAAKEKKHPLLALVVKGKKGFWLVGQAGDLLAAAKAREAVVKASNENNESATDAHYQSREPGELGADMSTRRCAP